MLKSIPRQRIRNVVVERHGSADMRIGRLKPRLASVSSVLTVLLLIPFAPVPGRRSRMSKRSSEPISLRSECLSNDTATNATPIRRPRPTSTSPCSRPGTMSGSSRRPGKKWGGCWRAGRCRPRRPPSRPKPSGLGCTSGFAATSPSRREPGPAILGRSCSAGSAMPSTRTLSAT